MPVITALKPQQKRRQRLAVFVDNEFFAGIDREVAAQLRLQVGDAVETRDLAKMLEREEEVRAREKCLRWLEAHTRTRRELADRLRRLEVAPAIAARVLDRLEQTGLLNDAALAKSMAQERLRGGSVGKRRLRSELIKRGMDRETVESTLETVGEGDEGASCLALAQRKAAAYRRLPLEIGRRRLVGFLARRGFGLEDIYRAVDLALPHERDERENA
jgi:regulatory protein